MPYDPTNAVDREHRALDAIHAALALPEHEGGMMPREIADFTGLGIGFVETLLKANRNFLRKKHCGRWQNDWNAVEENFRPAIKRGRRSSAELDSMRATAKRKLNE